MFRRGNHIAADYLKAVGDLCLLHGVGADRTAGEYQVPFLWTGNSVADLDMRGARAVPMTVMWAEIFPISLNELATDVVLSFMQFRLYKADWVGNDMAELYREGISQGLLP